ncbi:MAG TPA: MATE family efflux transporter [Candidatus Marinimicrobia bacterium]|nr:MATE family efflux transporter [Candidatus Neomarinimicrobiota bacterium]HRS51640.1 MATE family efflux transporter [Candidatus Neomarinimicrobiota bacterium]HRU93235.1 MATE family efflux transporter [Candidatus Neomarinimicrobiota bacterium]
MATQRTRKVEKGLVEGRLSRSIWKLAAPMMIGGALHDLFSMVDLFFVGKLGHIEVAALSIAGTTMAIMMMLVQGIGVGTVALVAHFTGEKNYEKSDEVLGQTLILGIIGAVIMLIVSFFLIEPLLKLFGAKGDVLTYAADYLRINFTYSIIIFLFSGVNSALQGSGDVKTPLYALIVGNILNIILDPLLIMGYGPFPAMGVAGSAAATVITRGIGLLYLFFHLLFGHSTIHLKKIHFKPDPALMRRIVSIGFYASLQVFIREVSFLFLMRLVTSFGDVTLAAYGIGSRIRSFIMVPGFGFASAAAVLVGQNLGAGKPERAKRSAWRAVIYYETIAIPIALVFLIFAPTIVGIFNDHPEVITIGSSFLRYLAVTFPFMAFSLVFSQALNGAGDTKTATIVNAIGQLGFRIPFAYFFARTVGLGYTGVWLGINASDIVQGIGMIFVFNAGHWQKVFLKHKKKLAYGLEPSEIATELPNLEP